MDAEAIRSSIYVILLSLYLIDVKDFVVSVMFYSVTVTFEQPPLGHLTYSNVLYGI